MNLYGVHPYVKLSPERFYLWTDSPIYAVVHKTLSMTARSCMVSANASEVDLEPLREDPPFPEKSACILNCLLEKINIVKSGKFSKSGFMTTISPLVFTNKKKMDHMKTVSENCDKEVNHDVSSCELANEITSCIYKYAPELHFKN
ncbi:odorant-binding protein 3 precursor [Danaus plexippus plexippus]|uniref:Odorant-binding protein 3 n=1 Tax=Danaus plexippus plexippus TaxID=278856 RepID=A0A212EWA9_DANPL|nr:odorant-binding protein 3 precursor [Danaus plexippus plexippus]